MSNILGTGCPFDDVFNFLKKNETKEIITWNLLF